MIEKNADRFTTQLTLLVGVRDPSNHRAWEAFIALYGPMIRRWCRQWFPDTTEEMSQEVFAKLVVVMRDYQYQPEKGRFRGWLKTVTLRLMIDLKRKKARCRQWAVTLEEIEAPLRLEERLAVEYDLELLERARENVRGRVEGRTWSAYEETAEQERDASEVARELGMKVGAVYRARHRVMTAMRREVDILELIDRHYVH